MYLRIIFHQHKTERDCKPGEREPIHIHGMASVQSTVIAHINFRCDHWQESPPHTGDLLGVSKNGVSELNTYSASYSDPNLTWY